MINFFINKKWKQKNSSIYKNIKKSLLLLQKELKINKDYFFELSFVSENKIQEINHKYRQKNQPTDVITFALNDSKIKIKNCLLGEIYLCKKQIKNKASAFHLTYLQNIINTFIHGVLHLLGYKHETKQEENKMISLQNKILNELFLLV